MQLFVFSSNNLTNIWAGIGARKWAVSETQGSNPSIQGKARKFPIGALGIFYCVETKSLTTPFMVYSKPVFDTVISSIWPEPWTLPFGIIPLGSPQRQLSKDVLATLLPSLNTGNKQWTDVFHFQPITVFAPSEISQDDWSILVTKLTESELN